MREVVELMLNAGVVLLPSGSSEVNKRPRGRGTIDPSCEIVRVYLTAFLGGAEPNPIAHFSAKQQILDWVTAAVQQQDSLRFAARTVAEVRRVIKLADAVYYSCEHLFDVNYVRTKTTMPPSAHSFDSLNSAAQAHCALKIGFDQLAHQVARRMSRLIVERVSVPTDLMLIAEDIKFVAQSYAPRTGAKQTPHPPQSQKQSANASGTAPHHPEMAAPLPDQQVDLSLYRNDFEVLAFEGFKEIFSRPSFHAALGTPREMVRFAQTLVPFAADFMHHSSGVPLMELALSCFFSSAMECAGNLITPDRLRSLMIDGNPELVELHGLCRTFGSEGLDHFFVPFSKAALMMLEESSQTIDGTEYLAAVDRLLHRTVPLSPRLLTEIRKCVSADFKRRGAAGMAVGKEVSMAVHRYVRSLKGADDGLPRSLELLVRCCFDFIDAESKKQFFISCCNCFIRRCVVGKGSSTVPPVYHPVAERRLLEVLKDLGGSAQGVYAHAKLIQDMDLSLQAAAGYNTAFETHDSTQPTAADGSTRLPALGMLTVLSTNNAFEHLRGYRLSPIVPRCLKPAADALCAVYASLMRPARKFLWVLSKMMLTVQLCDDRYPVNYKYPRTSVVLSAIHFAVLNALAQPGGPSSCDDLALLGVSSVLVERCAADLFGCRLIDMQRRINESVWLPQEAAACSHVDDVRVPSLDDKLHSANLEAKKNRERDTLKLEAHLVRLFKSRGVLRRDPSELQGLLGLQPPPPTVTVQRALERLLQRGYLEPSPQDPTTLKYVP